MHDQTVGAEGHERKQGIETDNILRYTQAQVARRGSEKKSGKTGATGAGCKPGPGIEHSEGPDQRAEQEKNPSGRIEPELRTEQQPVESKRFAGRNQRHTECGQHRNRRKSLRPRTGNRQGNQQRHGER